jgi:hypothetical protein
MMTNYFELRNARKHLKILTVLGGAMAPASPPSVPPLAPHRNVALESASLPSSRRLPAATRLLCLLCRGRPALLCLLPSDCFACCGALPRCYRCRREGEILCIAQASFVFPGLGPGLFWFRPRNEWIQLLLHPGHQRSSRRRTRSVTWEWNQVNHRLVKIYSCSA